MSKNFELLQLLERGVEAKAAQLAPATGITKQKPRPGKKPSPRVRANQNQPQLFLLLTLQKYWRTSALFAMSVICATALVTFLTKPVYEPTVTLEIDPPGTQAFALERGGMGSNDAEYLETQSKMLESDELAVSVIRKLHLDNNPEFVHPSNTKAKIESSAHDNGIALELSPHENAALISFRGRLKVQRDTSSRLISVSFAAHDPRLAAEVANELVSEFNESNLKSLHEAILQSSAWLSRQLDDIRSKMEQSGEALVTFQKKTGIADLDTNRSTVADEVSTLDQQLASARADRIQLESQLAKATENNVESLPQSTNNPLIQNLLQKLADARTELSQTQVEYGKNHPKVKKLVNEIDQLQSELESQKKRILEEIKSSYAAAQSRERMLEHEQARSTRQLGEMAEYNSLKKDFQTQSELYNSLYARVKEAGIAAASNSTNVRLIDHARVLQTPTRPRIAVNLALGILAALVGGVMLACIRERFETRIHTPEDILNATGVQSVSVLPAIGKYDSQRGLSERSTLRLNAPRNGNGSVSKFLLEQPRSMEAEAFRGLYTTIMLSQGGTPPQALLVVSGSPGEGKTTIASNLGIALADRGPTCLVDGDLRKGSISLSFGVPASEGLATVLAGAAQAADVLKTVPDIPNLSILPAGTAYRNPAELMAGESMKSLLDFLRERFEFVVFDSPPILPYADGRLLATLVDGLIFVGRHGATTRTTIARSVEMLSAIHAAPILEIVLNGVTSAQSVGYYGSYY